MSLRAGAAEVDITPHESQFLFGYPHVERYSTGVHDPLFSSALVLSDGKTTVAWTANDVIFVDKTLVASARARIAEATGIPGKNVFITATHTHSGPHTVDHLSNEGDPVVPKADPVYRRQLEDGIVRSACEAFARLSSARLGLAIADATGIGTNRRDPNGPADLEVPVLRVDSAAGAPIACMLVCSMHPTVLHEDSTEISADFPGFARDYIKRHSLGRSTPILYHSGPAGNQSPRHVTKANTFGEAERIGAVLGRSVVTALDSVGLRGDIPISVASAMKDLPVREFPTVEEAERYLQAADDRLGALRESNAPGRRIRTAEVDLFGAEETLTLARAAALGRAAAAARRCLPAEIMAVSIGPWSFVGFPGELFVEYGLELKSRCPGAYAVSLANGELQGYIVTAEAARSGGYEASNALFHHSSGEILLDCAVELLGCR